MADLTPNKRPDGQSPEDGGLEKSLESLSLDELLASVKDDLARVDAMMNDKDEEEQAKTQAEAELEQETQPQKQTPNMPPLFEPKINCFRQTGRLRDSRRITIILSTARNRNLATYNINWLGIN